MACWRRHRLLICLSLALIRCKAKQRRLQMSLKKRKRRFWVRKIFRRKHKSEYYNLVQELRLDDREYHFRYMWMSKERFDHLFSLLSEHLIKHTTKFRKPVPARERLVITLRYLASGMSQQDLSYSFREGRATICNIIKKTCMIIIAVLSPIYLSPPRNERDWLQISQEFEKIWHLMHVLGTLDGKHIAMDCPIGSGSHDHNYKGFFSLVLLALCDARYQFTLIDVGQYGSNNDCGVLNNSEIGQRMELRTRI